MKTVYNIEISNKLTSSYLDYLTNKIFALLPMFEESTMSEDNNISFNTYQKTLIQTINGNANLINYNSCLVVDILSHLQSLLLIQEHDDYKRHIFRICRLMSSLKKEVEKNGL